MLQTKLTLKCEESLYEFDFCEVSLSHSSKVAVIVSGAKGYSLRSLDGVSLSS